MDRLEGPPPSDGLSVRPVELTPEQKTKLTDYIVKEIEDAIRDRQGMERQCMTSLQQYNSRLRRPDATGALESDLDMTVTREFCQQNRSRLENPLFQQDVLFVSNPRKPNFEEAARVYEGILDFICDKAEMLTFVDSFLLNSQIFPYAVAKVPWVVEKRKVKEWQQTQTPVIDPNTGQPSVQQQMDQFGTPGQLPVTQPQQIESERWVVERTGAYPETVPTLDFIFPASARNVRTAAWVDHRIYLSKGELKSRVREGIYEDVIAKLGDPMAKKSDFAVEESKLVGIDLSNSKLYEIHEVYLSYDVDDDGTEEEIILTVELKSRTLLRCVHNFYHDYLRPFVTWSYEDRAEGIAGISLASILEPLHRAYSASINQRLDAASKANEILVIGRVGSGLDKLFRRGKLKGGYYETTGNPGEDLKQFPISQPFTQLKELEGVFEQRMQKVSGLTDYNFGVEQIARPTASGQTTLIEEGKQPLFVMLERFRSVFAEIARMMLARYKQFYPQGLEVYRQIETPQGQQIITELMQWPEGAIDEQVFVETKVSSATMNKQMRRQEKLALVDKLPQVYQALLQMVSVAVNPSPMAPAAAKLVPGIQKVIADWLTEFDIGNQEILNPDLTMEIQNGQQMGLAQMAQAMQAQQDAAAGAGVSGGGGAKPGAVGPA